MLTLKCICVGLIGCCMMLLVLAAFPFYQQYRFEKIFDQYDKDMAKLQQKG